MRPSNYGVCLQQCAFCLPLGIPCRIHFTFVTFLMLLQLGRNALSQHNVLYQSISRQMQHHNTVLLQYLLQHCVVTVPTSTSALCRTSVHVIQGLTLYMHPNVILNNLPCHKREAGHKLSQSPQISDTTGPTLGFVAHILLTHSDYFETIIVIYRFALFETGVALEIHAYCDYCPPFS